MKALVYRGPGCIALEEQPRPLLVAPTDVIVRIVRTTICGSDLHIVKGSVASCQPGRILGHEGVGVVDAVGPGVMAFRPGDRVLISCISTCGRCAYCRRLMYSHCTSGGWILGNEIDGTQAEWVRIPYADCSLYRIPEGADEEAMVMQSGKMDPKLLITHRFKLDGIVDAYDTFAQAAMTKALKVLIEA